MEQFGTHLEIYQLCETVNIKNAQVDIKNHVSENEKNIPQDEKIIEFINSLSDHELKYYGVPNIFDFVLNVRNVIE